MNAVAARLANAPEKVGHGICGYWLGDRSCARPARYVVSLSDCHCTINGRPCRHHYACAEHAALVRSERRAVEIESLAVAS